MATIGHGILTALLALVASGEGGWQEFRSEEGNFLLWIPAKPEEIKVDRCPPGARVWQASGEPLLTLFQFGFISRQKEMSESEADAFLEAATRASAEGLKGSVTSTRKVTLSRWPGRETQVKFMAGHVEMCLFDRVYSGS
jgi:hypothetical protein